MAAIKQHLWVEWREQRSNLLGLWGGLVLLILVATFFGTDMYVLDPQVPVLFAALGYLAFVLGILPRVFSGESLRRSKGVLERSPSGLTSAFLGKALFVHLGMAGSVLLCFATAATQMYLATPDSFDKMRDGHSGFEYFAIPLLAVHALPLVVMSWRLPLRWALGGTVMTALVMFVAVKAAYLGTFDPGGHQYSREFVFYSAMGLILAPWILAWGSFLRPNGEAPSHHMLRSLGLLLVGLSPTWGMGLVSFAEHEFEVRKVNPRTFAFEIKSAFLTPDNRTIFFTGGNRVSDWQGDRSIKLYTMGLNLETMTTWCLGLGTVVAETESGLTYRGQESFPHANRLVVRRFDPREGSEHFAVDLKTGKQSPQEQVVWTYQNPERLAAMGLSPEWMTYYNYVGLGSSGRRISDGLSHWALFDPTGNRTYFADDLPFPIDLHETTVRILQNEWLVSEQSKTKVWQHFDPKTGVLSTAQGLSN
ncbi:MAG: hypothetical protein JKY61_07215, partial [Planctomycetes bacterium]|nr:hypothetical protein [Planctomycetota bacterium]